MKDPLDSETRDIDCAPAETEENFLGETIVYETVESVRDVLEDLSQDYGDWLTYEPDENDGGVVGIYEGEGKSDHAVAVEWDEDPENPEADLKYHISSY